MINRRPSFSGAPQLENSAVLEIHTFTHPVSVLACRLGTDGILLNSRDALAENPVG